MKTYTISLMAAGAAVLLTGCQYPNGEPNNTASGALIGGAIGNSMDQEQAAALRAQSPETYVRVQQGQPLTIADVKALAEANVSDDVIISQIRNSHTVFHLSASDIIDLHNAGVSSNVINFMINTPSMIGENSTVQTTTVVAGPPPPPPVQPVVLAPGPGYVWVGGEWLWNGRWVWRAGYWSLPPYPHAVWVGGHWGSGPHGWYRRPGHWR